MFLLNSAAPRRTAFTEDCRIISPLDLLIDDESYRSGLIDVPGCWPPLTRP